VWVAATSEPTAALAADRGLPLLLGMHATSAEKRRLLDHYERHGPAGAVHASAHLAYVADTAEQAETALRAAMPGWLATTSGYVRIDGSAGPGRNPHVYLEHLLDIHPVGPPQRCVQRLNESISTTGIRRILLMAEGAGGPRATLHNITRLGAEVIPSLRRLQQDPRQVAGPLEPESEPPG
jgi:hypothetical protein